MIDPSIAGRFALLLVRPGMVVLAAPPFGSIYTPPQVKIGLSVILAVVMLPVVPLPEAATSTALAVVVAREAAVGLAVAMAIRVLLAGAEFAGQLAGFQLGFAYAAIVDPLTGARNNVVTTIYSSLTLLTLLAINGHHALLRALAHSYTVLPVGTGSVDRAMGLHVAGMLGLIFTLGAQLAAPIVIVLVIVEIVLGLLSRAAPALNLLVLGFPIRLLVGLAALAGAVAIVPGVVGAFAPAALSLAMRLAGTLR